MLLPTLLLATVFTTQDAPRLRTLLPNGTSLLVERMERAPYVSVQLFARFNTLEKPETHGQRHLLEHLILRGKDGRLDTALETQGMFLSGHTLRDAMQIEVTCGPDQVARALQALEEVIEAPAATPESIAHESKILQQELAVQADSLRLASAAWEFAYGAEGLDPLGRPAQLSGATPEGLQALQKELFAPSNISVVVSGPIEIEATTQMLSKKFESRSGAKAEDVAKRGAGQSGRAVTSSGFGEGRAALVRSFKEPDTAWALAAGLALASLVEDSFFIYTPTTKSGLMLTGQTSSSSGFGALVDSLEQADVVSMYPLGKQLALQWVKRQLNDPASNSSLRGLLLSQGPSNRAESLLENLNSMTWQDFLKGVGKYRERAAVQVSGVRS